MVPNLLVKGVVIKIEQDISVEIKEVVGLCVDGPNLV